MIEGTLVEEVNSGWWCVRNRQQNYYFTATDTVSVRLGDMWVRADVVPGEGLRSNRLRLSVDGSLVPEGTAARLELK